MQPIIQEPVLTNYWRAVQIGAYDRLHGGLFGKHDNTRRLWEDICTRRELRQFAEGAPWLTQQPLHVANLGCGPGAGYDLLFTTPLEDESVLPLNALRSYTGFDISPAMIEKAREQFEGNPRTRFHQCDLGAGLPTDADHPPYTLFFSSYAALSHLNPNGLRQLLHSIFQHMAKRAIFVADLLGKWSWEWTSYWREDDPFSDVYSMSYIYLPHQRVSANPERFLMWYWSGSGFDAFVQQVAEESGVHVLRKVHVDRSIFVGRHTDTREFNPKIQPIRTLVNSLFEPYHPTRVRGLLIHPLPPAPDAFVNEFFEHFRLQWNALVEAWLHAVERSPDAARAWLSTHPLHERTQELALSLVDGIEALQRLKVDAPITNFAEPLLGFTLRRLERRLQRGLGCGHGLLAYYEFERS